MVIWCTKACQRAKSHELLNVCCSDQNDCSDGMDIKAGRLQAGDLLDMRKMYDTSRESTVNGVSAIWFGKTSWRGFYFFFHSRTLGCETGIPFLITDRSTTASSQKELCRADRYHGVFGEDRFWCSEEEKTSYIEIQFSMRYKIIGARIQLLRKYNIKDIILKIQLFDQWINIHYVKVSGLMKQQITSTTVVSTVTVQTFSRVHCIIFIDMIYAMLTQRARAFERISDVNFLCVCLVIDNEFRHNFGDLRGDNNLFLR